MPINNQYHKHLNDWLYLLVVDILNLHKQAEVDMIRFEAKVDLDDTCFVYDNVKHEIVEYPFNYLSEAQERADELNGVDECDT